jgi:hypothetical protein
MTPGGIEQAEHGIGDDLIDGSERIHVRVAEDRCCRVDFGGGSTTAQ